MSHYDRSLQKVILTCHQKMRYYDRSSQISHCDRSSKKSSVILNESLWPVITKDHFERSSKIRCYDWSSQIVIVNGHHKNHLVRLESRGTRIHKINHYKWVIMTGHYKNYYDLLSQMSHYDRLLQSSHYDRSLKMSHYD